MEPLQLRRLVLLAAVVCAGVALWVLAGSPPQHAAVRPFGSGLRGVDFRADSLVIRAFMLPATCDTARPSFAVANPFGGAGSVTALSGRSSGVRKVKGYERVELRLKGVLIKEAPMAILESADGASVILGIGEKVFGQTILAITAREVKLQDVQGSYSLTVAE